MSGVMPAARPDVTRDGVLEWLRSFKLRPATFASGLVVVGRRGYYRDTMGAPGANDIGVYDDAIVVLSPTVCVAFNGNTDPSSHAPGRATLCPGIYTFERVIHNRSKDPATHPHYPAFGQRGDVLVHRDGTDTVQAGRIDERGLCLGRGQWKGDFAIHLHKGGHTTTSSEGCQTIPPEQWDAEAYALIDGEMRRLGVDTFLYILTERGEA